MECLQKCTRHLSLSTLSGHLKKHTHTESCHTGLSFQSAVTGISLTQRTFQYDDCLLFSVWLMLKGNLFYSSVKKNKRQLIKKLASADTIPQCSHSLFGPEILFSCVKHFCYYKSLKVTQCKYNLLLKINIQLIHITHALRIRLNKIILRRKKGRKSI